MEIGKKSSGRRNEGRAASFSGAAAVCAAEMTIRALGIGDYNDFLTIASQSELPTLVDPLMVKRLLENGIVFGGFVGGRIIACCCIQRDVRKDYIAATGRTEFPMPNIYFCGAFVLPEFRRLGIGEYLYKHRLEFARVTFKGTIIVELLGNGSSSSVKPETLVGYKFYLKHGFKELGYSIDEDAGKIVFFELT
jgi:GNAT superfamily N-acetyltransferase